MRKQILDIVEYIRTTYKDSNALYVNQVIYYADFLSIELYGYPITWSTYFNINGQPYNSSLLIEQLQYSHQEHADGALGSFDLSVDDSDFTDGILGPIKQAVAQFNLLRSQLGVDGVNLFVSGICDIQGKPRIDYKYMLGYTLRGKDKMAKTAAYDKLEKAYLKHMLGYTKVVKGDDGEDVVILSTKYAAD